MVGRCSAIYGSSGFDPGTYEVIRPVAMFLSQFIKPPDDYVSVVAFDMRPTTPLTDFTNDPDAHQSGNQFVISGISRPFERPIFSMR